MGFLLWHGLRDSALRHPDRPAVEWRKESLSYRELDESSDAIAATLAAAGIGPGHRVGLYTLKNHRSVAAILGISKAGVAYVPIDPHAPPARAAYILGDCAVSAVVATADRLASLASHRAELPSLALALVSDAAKGPESFVRMCGWDELESGDGRVRGAAVETDPAYLLYLSLIHI